MLQIFLRRRLRGRDFAAPEQFRLRRRVRRAPRLDRPTREQQAQNEAQNQLLLFGQTVHVPKYSGKPAKSQ
jgi:hypothetical protein